MSAAARRPRFSCNRGAGARLTAIALACALAASSSQAFALIIPITASLSGAGEVPPNNSAGKGRMTGTFDTDTNTLTWTVTYSGLSGPAIATHFHGPVAVLCATEGIIPGQSNISQDYAAQFGAGWDLTAISNQTVNNTTDAANNFTWGFGQWTGTVPNPQKPSQILSLSGCWSIVFWQDSNKNWFIQEHTIVTNPVPPDPLAPPS